MKKIFDQEGLKKKVQEWKTQNKRVVFTNGCFDLFHRGHVEYLKVAKSYGDKLVVGLNSDTSVSRLKGPGRPFNDQGDRAFMLAQLISVDAVCIFEEDTPAGILNYVKPDILAKGADYRIDEVVGRDFVESYGGKVCLVPLTEGKSTTDLIKKILISSRDQKTKR